MAEVIRKSGAAAIADVTWGTHICQFYKTKEDLIDVLVPYFKAGLDNNEFCMWVTSEPLGVEDAKRALERVIRNLDDYIKKGQIEIFDYGEWYTKSGKFDGDEVLQGWVEKEKLALEKGFEGLRLTGNTFWLETKHWEDFTAYEAKIDNVIGNYRMMAVCTYSLDKCGASEITDVVGNHTSALVKKQDKWQVIGNTGRLKAEEKFLKYFNGNPKPMIIIELAEGRYTDVNASFVRFTGYSRKDVIGRKSTDIYWLQSNTRIKLQETVCDRGGVYDLEIGFRTKSGETRSALFAAETITIDGQPHLLCSMNDITEHKRAEDEKRQLEQKAQLVSRLAFVGELASGVAHEINNPLTGVIGYAQLLMDREDVPSDIRSDLAAINDGAQRVAGIVKRLLTFSRQTKPERKLVDINELIESTLILRAYHFRVNDIEVVTRLATDVLETVADPGQIQQVLLNLIVNAETEMKLAHGKGKLTITTEKSHNTIKICCQDDGPGIKPEVMDKIFNPFFTTREVGEGTGLGLSICHGIVTEHRGRIWAESEPGKGATFIMELPVVTAAEQPKPSEPVVEEPEKVAKARILVVDYEQIIRDFVKRVLAGEGYEVETANNAAAALKKIESKRYSLILVAIKMPGMDGVELYKRIQKIARSLARRVVFITDDIVGAANKEFLSETKVAHIEKPFDAEQLSREVKRALIGGQ
jgi:PAS domain S-box-containing protein